MSDIIIKQMPAFKKAYKKLHSNQIHSVNEAIKAITKNPKIGEEKKGDLSGIFVYKFKIHHQLMLLAYEWDPKKKNIIGFGHT